MSETIKVGFLGDLQSHKVHHLGMMTTQCNIYKITKQEKKYFDPDTIEQALKEGFQKCKWCITN